MPFNPEIGHCYAKLSIDKDKSSTQAEYFKNMVSGANRRRPDDYVFVDYTSSVVVWCRTEPACNELVSRMVDLGIPFSFDWVEFNRKHLDRIELNSEE